MTSCHQSEYIPRIKINIHQTDLYGLYTIVFGNDDTNVKMIFFRWNKSHGFTIGV